MLLTNDKCTLVHVSSISYSPACIMLHSCIYFTIMAICCQLSSKSHSPHGILAALMSMPTAKPFQKIHVDKCSNGLEKQGPTIICPIVLDNSVACLFIGDVLAYSILKGIVQEIIHLYRVLCIAGVCSDISQCMSPNVCLSKFITRLQEKMCNICIVWDL